MLTVKMIVDKGRLKFLHGVIILSPWFLYISKGRKSETVMAHKNKT